MTQSGYEPKLGSMAFSSGVIKIFLHRISPGCFPENLLHWFFLLLYSQAVTYLTICCCFCLVFPVSHPTVIMCTLKWKNREHCWYCNKYIHLYNRKEVSRFHWCERISRFLLHNNNCYYYLLSTYHTMDAWGTFCKWKRK